MARSRTTAPESLLRFRSCARTLFFCFLICTASRAQSAESDWANQPKPAFPMAALGRNSEGVVRLRIVMTKQGAVQSAVVTKSSGDRDLDEAARKGVLAWRMKRDAIKSADLVGGRDILIDFREEAAVAARYPDRVVASFAHLEGAEPWRSAPFPTYPMEARLRREQGTVRLKVRIGRMGNVEGVEIAQSSGHKVLDDAALAAVRIWKAQARYSGQTFTVPITFAIGFHSP
jgi:TonB family protein